MGKSVNKRELAEILGKSERALTDWQADGLPVERAGERGESNRYDTERVIQWWVDREVGKVQTESAKDRLARLQADRVQIDIDEKMARLVPIDQIEPTWLALISAARSYLRAEPDRLAHMLEASEGVDAKRDLLAEVFDEFLRKLAAYEPDDDAADPRAVAPGRPQAGAAAEDDGGPVGREVPLPLG